MGGAKAGETASQVAVHTVKEMVASKPVRDGQALLDSVERANLEVLSLARSDRSLEGMGTTLVAALDQGEELVIASVGDSRAYLYDGETLTAVTQDQSWVNEVGRMMGIDEETLKVHPMRHVLTMALGVNTRLVVNSYRFPWPEKAVVLLCSDGLHGVVDPAEIETILRQEGSLEDRCRALIEAARGAGGPDNITAVLMRRR
jgi:protein phosphatase